MFILRWMYWSIEKERQEAQGPRGLSPETCNQGTLSRSLSWDTELINSMTQGFSPDHLISPELCKQACFKERKKCLDSKGGNVLHKFVVLLTSWLDSNLHHKNKTKQNLLNFHNKTDRSAFTINFGYQTCKRSVRGGLGREELQFIKCLL